MNQHPFMVADERAVQHLNFASGSSLIASSAYQHGQLGTVIEKPMFKKHKSWTIPMCSLRTGQGQRTPESSNHELYLRKVQHSSYPEGNFGGNQRLDGSISLSPHILKFVKRCARQCRYEPPFEYFDKIRHLISLFTIPICLISFVVVFW